MATRDDAKAAVERSIAEVQERVDAENKQGFAGDRVDETPRENYTVAGVVAGKPVPEVEKFK